MLSVIKIYVWMCGASTVFDTLHAIYNWAVLDYIYESVKLNNNNL